MVERMTMLVDFPVVYMVDPKSHWEDFKKAVKAAALAWNFREWLNTTVYGSDVWRQIEMLGYKVKREPVEAKEDAPAPPPNVMDERLLKIMGYTDMDFKFFQSTTKFINVVTLEYESSSLSAARQKLWTWMVKSLRGSGVVAGPFHYLTDTVTAYDVAGLFSELVRVIDTPTILSQAAALDDVFTLQCKPPQDVFGFLTELRKNVRKVHNMNNVLPENCRVNIPDSFIRARILQVLTTMPVYRTFMDSLMIKKPDEWGAITVEDLYKHLEVIAANSRDMGKNRTPTNLSVQAHTVRVQQDKPKKGRCYEYEKNGECSKKGCKFSHEKPSQPAPSAPKADVKEEPKKSGPGRVCFKCGEADHMANKCKFNGTCSHCKRQGHTDAMCREKKSGKPQVLMTDVKDGGEVQMKLFCVGDALPETLALSMSVPDDGMLVEKFLADSGANRSLHPNLRSAASFYRTDMDIGTANGSKTMKADGMGTMRLYTSKGEPMPGFENVVYSREAAAKLASVGDMCDAGMICVFDADRLRTFKASEVKIEGQAFTEDPRDPKSRLYPLTLLRKDKEKERKKLLALQVVCAQQHQTNWGELPESIDDDGAAHAFLAKSYKRESLSELDRWHGKLGDVGVKHMKLVLPTMTIPKKYRCDFCIEGKIHKFGHPKCGPDDRIKYGPGVCIHSDHSGPYAMSLGGHRYSQLFMDVGTGYLWAVTMRKKSDHYEALKKILSDCQAASGKPVQFFQSDGEGVFAAKETEEILVAAKVRHLWGAPHDSNTNAFIERARRTVFEGTSTSLIRSGAPSNFWGEAEAHKIFTMNVIPSVEDPDEKGKFLSKKNLLEGNKRPFNLKHLMAFGTAATCYIPIPNRSGGKAPGQRKFFRGAIVGYAENMPAYRVWNFSTRKVCMVSYNFTVAHEGYYPFKDKSVWTPDWETLPESFTLPEGVSVDSDVWKSFDFDEEDASEALTYLPITSGGLSTITLDPLVKGGDSEGDEVLGEGVLPIEVDLGGFPDPEVDVAPVAPELDEKHVELPKEKSQLRNFWEGKLVGPEVKIEPPPEPVQPVRVEIVPVPVVGEGLRRSARIAELPVKNYAQLATVSNSGGIKGLAPEDKPSTIPPPKTLREAKLSPWWPQYEKACRDEIEGHEKNGTWELVPLSSVPRNKNILRGKFVFDDKRGEDGRVARFKARFVAMGFTQQFGSDYTETFAAVVITKSFRTMLSILNEDPTYNMEHWDVKMAFTKAPVEEELFMFQPENYERTPSVQNDQQGSGLSGNSGKFICKLKKSLYGLKQSARNWQLLLREIFLENNFVSLFADPCVFFSRKGDGWCVVATHVDDIFPLFNAQGKIIRDNLFTNFGRYVEIGNLGNISWALKTHIQRDREKGVLKISQALFTRDFLESSSIKLEQATTPTVTSGGDLSMTPEDFLGEEDGDIRDYHYQSDIGSFWWLAQISRPDIFYAVHRASKYATNPSRKLWRWLQQIKKYLNGTISVGLVYQRSGTKTPLLSGFADAAYNGEFGQSRTGYFFLCNGNLVSWGSENPKRVMTSSTEVECRALVQFSKENLWQRQFHGELGLFKTDGPTIVYEDNSASISLSKIPGNHHKKSKHFGLEWSMFKESVEFGEIEPVFVKTDEQAADMLTKPLSARKFVYFRDLVMGEERLQLHFSTGAPDDPEKLGHDYLVNVDRKGTL